MPRIWNPDGFATPTALPVASAAGSGRLARFVTASLARELGVLLCLSVMFPFMVHILPVPGEAQVGPRLLPRFYAPLLATLWGRLGTAVTVTLLAPVLNWALTGHPAPAGIVVMTVQLAGFSLALRGLLAGVGAHCLLAAAAYFVGLALAALLASLIPSLIGGQAALSWAVNSAVTGLPGIAIFVLISWLALRHYPPGAAAA